MAEEETLSVEPAVRRKPRPGRQRDFNPDAPYNAPYASRGVDPNTQTDYELWLTTESQAAHLIRKFGGPRYLADVIGYDRSQIYRWTYPEKPHPKRGTGGVVPRRAVERMVKAARALGVLLTDEDFKLRLYQGPKRLPRPHAPLEDLLS